MEVTGSLNQPLLPGRSSPPPLDTLSGMLGTPVVSSTLQHGSPLGSRSTPSRPKKKKGAVRVWAAAGACALVGLLALGERVLFKVLVDVMPERVEGEPTAAVAGALVAALVNVMVVLVASSALLAYKLSATTTIDSEVTGLPKYHFFGIAVLDSIHYLCAFASGKFVPGALSATLLQLYLPFTVALSWLVFRTQYTKTHLLGAGVVVVGVGLSLLPAVTSLSGTAPDHVEGASLVYMLSTVSLAGSAMYKERVFRDKHMDDSYCAVWVSAFQILVLCLGSPVVVALQGLPGGGQVPSLVNAVRRGFDCLGASGTPAHTCHCSYALMVLVAFSLVTLAASWLVPVLIQRTGVLGYYRSTAAGCMCAAIILAAYHQPCDAGHWPGFAWPVALSVVVLCVGLGTYYLRPEPGGSWDTIVDDFPANFTYRAPVRPSTPPDGIFFPDTPDQEFK